MELNNTISAIVTGGASGLGKATAHALADAGVKVAILDTDEERGRATAAEISGVFAACDVTSEEAVRSALSEARADHGQERILVNCAGIAPASRTVRKDRETGAFTPHDLGVFARVIQINLIGTFNMIANCAAGMAGAAPLGADGERGVIICTSSVAAEDGQTGQAAYAASKGGVASMTLPIARDLAASGVRVASILPGLFHTPMFDGLPDDVRKGLADSVPFPSRLGHPEEFAALARHICENTMLNGTQIRLDGAVRLAAK